MALLLSETSEALFSIAPTATAYKATMIFNRRRPAAEFAIVFRQNSDGKEVSFDGFVLHKGKFFEELKRPVFCKTTFSFRHLAKQQPVRPLRPAAGGPLGDGEGVPGAKWPKAGKGEPEE